MIKPLRQIKKHVKHALKTLLFMFFKITRPNYKIYNDFFTLGSPEFHSFIGYYDIQPYNRDETKILYNRCPSAHNGRAMDQTLEIGYYDLNTQHYIKIATTPTWCWQQGCRLQWASWDDKEALLYNSLKNNKLNTFIYSASADEIVATLPIPTYCISKDGRYIASLDFDYLEKCRAGYGYDWKNTPKGTQKHTYFEIYNIEKMRTETTITTQEILKINPHDSMFAEDCVHYFNHLDFNPSRSRLMVFHIWDTAGKRRVRALTMNLDGSDMRDVTDSTLISHYWWMNDDELLFYGKDPYKGMGFHLYHQNGGYIKTLSKNMPKADGHPSLNPHNTDMLVSDNVVNRKSERDLWLYDIQHEERTMLAHLYSPPKYTGPTRCDLHPRWSPTGKSVVVDSAHAGYRQILIVDT